MTVHPPLTCFLADADGAWLRQATERLWANPRLKVVGTATQIAEAADQVQLLQPAIVLLGEAIAPPDGVARIARACQGLVFRVVSDPAPEGLRESLAAGARGILSRDLTAEAVIAAADEALESARRAAERWEPARESHRRGQRVAGRGQHGAVARQAVIAVHSPKGGVGKTTLSISLAMIFAASPLKLSVGLIDLDPEYADVAAALHIAPTKTVLDWVLEPDAERDPPSFMVRHPSGLHVLPGSVRPPERGRLTAEVAARMFAAMRRALDVVVIDTGTSLHDDATLLALEQCTHGLIVASTYVPALREVESLGQTLQPLRIGGRLRLVFNRVPRQSDGLIAEAAQHLPWPIAGILPEDPDVVRFANDGRSFAVERPQTPFGRAVRRLAHQMVPIGDESRAPRGIAELLRTWQLRRAGT